MVASTDVTRLGGGPADEDIFIKGQFGDSASTLFIDDDRGMGVYLSGPISLENRLMGVVIIESSAAGIVSLVTDYSGLGQTGETFLAQWDKNGDALLLTPLRFDGDAALIRIVPQDNIYDPATQAMMRKEQLFTETVDYRGEPVFASTQYIERTDWGLVAKMDKAEAFAPATYLRDLLMPSVLASLAVAMLIYLFSARASSRPIANLTRTAIKISEGDLSQRAEVMSNGWSCGSRLPPAN